MFIVKNAQNMVINALKPERSVYKTKDFLYTSVYTVVRFDVKGDINAKNN